MKFLYTAVAVMTLFLASCGGSSGVSDSGGLPPTRSAGNLSGVAHDAPLRNAEVKIYDFTSGRKGELLSQTTTDAVGDYSINITTADKPILIVAGDSGSYTEEASGKSINLAVGQNISAVTYYQSGETLTLQVTPFTHLARCYAEYLVSDGESVPDALNLANSKIAAIAGVEIIKTKPIDVTDINSANIELTPGLKYGFLTAAISASMVDVSEANGLSPHSQTFLTSMQYSRVACNDIRADGLLNGYGYIDDTTKGTLSFGTFEITPSFYRNTLAQRILSFTKSEYNKTGLDIQQLLVFANALSTNTDTVWDGLPGQQVDTTGPTVEAQIAENSYIGGTTALPFTVEDPVGVNTIQFYIDNALLATQGPSGQTLNINTTNYLDGAHTIKVVAADVIGNETTLETIYKISNTGPAINLTSATVVGDKNYLAQGTWVSSGADIQTIVVDGSEATINPNGTWEVPLVLKSGVNSFGVVATDALSNSTTQTYQVGVDLNPPFVTLWGRDILQTTYEGLYNLCNSVKYFDTPASPICIRSDRVSLNGASVDSISGGQEFMYIKFEVEDALGAGVYTQFEDLEVTYKYERDGVLVKDYLPLNTGLKYTQPGALNGYYILPITTEYLGEDWYKTTTTDNHVITVRVTDSVGNYYEKAYTMQFDVLLYDVAAAGSSNGSSVMNQTFASRTIIGGSTIVSTATINNDTGNSIYLSFKESNDHNITQVYESAVRKNRAALVTTEEWRLGATPADIVYRRDFGYSPYGFIWTAITTPSPDVGDFIYVASDIAPEKNATEWSNNPESCTGVTYYQESATSTGSSPGDTFTRIEKQYHVAQDVDSTYGCKRTITGVIGQIALEKYVYENNFYKRLTYSHQYEEGYPRNEVSSNTINHDITDASYIVYDVTNASEVPMFNGTYKVESDHVVELRKTISLPNLPDYNDAEVSNLETFTSYEQKDLDKTITWSIDETIELDLFAVPGASAYHQSVGTKQNYTIARN